MALECLSDWKFSTYSDVWSFGVVLWELFSLRQELYVGLGPDKLHEKLKGGYRLEKPDNATQEM